MSQVTAGPPSDQEKNLLDALADLAQLFNNYGMTPRDIMTCYLNCTILMVLQNEGPAGLNVARDMIDAIEKHEVQ